MAIPFIDSFDGAGAATNLSAWTPTGGAAWTLASGTSLAARVETAGYITARSSTTSVHLCDDQGTDDHYVQARMGTLSNITNADVCVRLVDYDNRVGWRTSGSGATGSELRKRVGGTNTALITRQGVSNEHLRIEADGADNALKIRWYEGGTGGSPGTWNLIGSEQTITDSVFNGETSTGLASGSSSANEWIRAFESGPLSGGGGSTSIAARRAFPRSILNF